MVRKGQQRDWSDDQRGKMRYHTRMKTIIILVLAAALVAGLFLSKPTQADFTAYMSAQPQAAQRSAKAVGAEILNGILGNATASTMVYNDHVLWATEDQNGQTQYYGVFSHWFKKGAATTTAAGS
jgi:cytochrome c-type biogenesis protein CcmE